MWLIAGLGNPGSQYERTPHNLGFDVVDTLAARKGWTWRVQSRFQAVVAEGDLAGERLYLLKPLTYMNLSGEAVVPFMNYFRLASDQLLIVCDDIALPMGRLRLRTEGSEGGHNGLRSIAQHLGRTDYARLRFGIEPTGVNVRNLKDFVLQKMSGPYLEDAKLMTQIVADCAETVVTDGVVKAANKFNGYDARKLSS